MGKIPSAWQPDDAVCPRCMEDQFFQEYIREHADAYECSYCGRERDQPFALDVDEIIDRIRVGLESEWEDADESVPYVSREGGFLYPTYDSHELLTEVGFYAGNDELQDKIAWALPDRPWVEKDWQVGSRDQVLRDSWDRFSELVKHRHRYLFFPREQKPDPWNPRTPPGHMLDTVAEMIRDRHLLANIPAGTDMFRVRFGDAGERFSQLEDLCSPPTEQAVFANRMSPAGISAFYASFSEQTAKAETDDGRRPATMSIARFRARSSIPVVDLANIPDVPSLFADANRREDRPVLIFLHGFVRSLTRPITKDRREHIEYVPSQVVTEYLRDRFEGDEGTRPKGITYPSAAGRGGESLVLFYSHKDFTNDLPPAVRQRPPLELEAVSHQLLQPDDAGS